MSQLIDFYNNQYWFNYSVLLIIRLGWLEWITIALSGYVIGESLNALCRMPQAYEMLCHKVKYILALMSAIAFIYYVFQPLPREMKWVFLGVAGTLSFFVWPRMVFRLSHFLKELRKVQHL